MAHTTSADPRLGTTVADYLVLALAGRGGMGVVYRARDERLRRDVALKVLAPELTDDDQFRERFLRESRIAASLRHPNIVPVYAAGEAEGLLYLAMQFVDGADLKALLRRERALEPARALALLAQIAAALDTAQRHGLVHRDVKPANILLEGAAPDELAYLADFGLTKTDASRAGATATGQLMGTLDYIAPEQIRGQALDGRADIYSLACVLYECLAGTPPFAHASDVAVLYSHLHDAPPPASERRSGLPSAIDAVLARALAKRAEERHHSAGELVADAREALAGAGALPPLPVTEHGRLRLRLEQTFRPITRARRRFLRTLAASLAALTLVVGADRAGAFDRPEREAFDLRMSLRGEHNAPNVLVVRGAYYGGSPGPRRSAQAIKRLSDSGARAIAFNMPLNPSRKRIDWAKLIDAIDRAGNVVALWFQREQLSVPGSEPPRFANPGLPRDKDGVIRRIEYSVAGVTSFAVETASVALSRPIPRSEVDPDGAWIDFAGPPGKIPSLSFRDVVHGSFDARRVRGKVVVVGAIPGEWDTPVGNRMPDAEVEANAIQTILDGFPLHDAPRPVGVLAIVVLGIAGMLAASRLGRFTGLGAAFVLAAVYLVVVQGAFDAGIVLPVSYPLGALAAATIAVPLTRGW